MEDTYVREVHGLAEMATKIAFWGSPGLWGTWKDEAFNKELKAISFRAHRQVWMRRVLRNFYLARSSKASKRRRR